MAMLFDAATDRISYTGGSTPPDTSTGFSLFMWLRLDTDQSGSDTFFRLHAASGGTTRATCATPSTGTGPSIFTSGNTGGVICPASLTVGTWGWTGIACTGTTGTIYGRSTGGGSTQSASGTVSGGATATAFTLAGRSSADGSEWWLGALAYARLWSAVLTQSEFEAEAGATAAVRATNLWGDYPLASGGDLNDISGNARHLTAGSTATSTTTGPTISAGPAKGAQFLSFF
jgi:hypothetical protein